MKRLIPLATAALLAACGLPGVEAPVTRFPTKVLGAPFTLRPGQRLEASQLVERLRRLGYAPAGSAARPGTFRAEGASVELHLRGFRHPLGGGEPLRVSALFESGAIADLAGSEGAPVAQARLEPELLYEISGPQRVRREPSTFDTLPKHLLDAVVAMEDRRFYRHYGVDLRGLARAAWRDVRARKLVEGGSTITQQLARNLYLSHRRSFGRKLREMGLALLLELKHSKEDILRLYLDQVYFGQDGPVSVCGVQAAARFFFDKPPERLTLGESALLVGLLASPNRFNPFRYPDGALARRRAVLASMRQQGYITPEQERRARLEPLRVTRTGHQPGRPADFFVAMVQEELERRYPGETLITAGLTIHTTLDPWLQDRAQKAVARARAQAALVALEPETGAVRALVGGKDFLSSPFNRAASARRQPGSAFKPFVYGAALRGAEAGSPRWTAGSLVPDQAVTYRTEGSSWTPRNYDGVYRGSSTLRRALALSLNAPAVHVAQSLGTRRILDYARSLGVQSGLVTHLGLALGGGEVSLLELTGAYAPFANGGLRVDPYTVDAVVGPEGDVLEYRQPEGVRVLAPEEAWLMTDLLREAVRSGTARALARWGLDAVAAGKTGTTDGGKDAWFVGYVPGLACGVWSGHDRPRRTAMTGASDALPVWAEFIASAGPWPKDVEAWPKPSSIVSVDIDPASGALARAGCPVQVAEHYLPGTEPKEGCPLHAAGVVGWLKKLLGR
ncbi:MAG: PBP1A family penicillin-binding protein [Elusimicrobia bacterium]|nr:PBP1A family penicillin-binding protein [Elusimicrobiota bacterium]